MALAKFDQLPRSSPSPPRLIAPRRALSRYAEETGTRKSPNRERGGIAYAPHLRTYTQPAKLLAAGETLTAHTQSALRTGLMAPAWRLLHVSRRKVLD